MPAEREVLLLRSRRPYNAEMLRGLYRNTLVLHESSSPRSLTTSSLEPASATHDTEALGIWSWGRCATCRAEATTVRPGPQRGCSGWQHSVQARGRKATDPNLYLQGKKGAVCKLLADALFAKSGLELF